MHNKRQVTSSHSDFIWTITTYQMFGYKLRWITKEVAVGAAPSSNAALKTIKRSGVEVILNLCVWNAAICTKWKGLPVLLFTGFPYQMPICGAGNFLRKYLKLWDVLSIRGLLRSKKACFLAILFVRKTAVRLRRPQAEPLSVHFKGDLCEE